MKHLRGYHSNQKAEPPAITRRKTDISVNINTLQLLLKQLRKAIESNDINYIYLINQCFNELNDIIYNIERMQDLADD